MKKSVKALLLVLCAVVLVVATVFTTLAYMTSTTGKITNTFSVGSVKITMDESEVTAYGVKTDDGQTRVTANTYKLIPNGNYVKDPVIHVKPQSEESYLFVEIVNGISAIEAGTTIAQQMEANGWEQIGETNVYYLNTTKTNNSETDDVNVPVFQEFTLGTNVDSQTYNGATITLIGYAIQAEGFDTAELAWAAAGAGLQQQANQGA